MALCGCFHCNLATEYGWWRGLVVAGWSQST